MIDLWRKAMTDVQILHVDPTCEPKIDIYGTADKPFLKVFVRNARDTVCQERRLGELTISCVRLTFWPGTEAAQKWIAAAWAGYMQHEALELVMVDNARILDPHQSADHDRGVRLGFPGVLTPETMEQALSLVMHRDLAAQIVSGGTNAD